jgi:D-glycero-D-manno-heptose 1,7-bisphosphate phosphatase
VILKDTGYIGSWGETSLLPGSVEAIKRLNYSGFLVIVVTNQSGVARGYFTEADVETVNEQLKKELSLKGARVDAIFYCPHHVEGQVREYRLDCNCRKPKPGLILEAASRFGIDISRSFMVGDKLEDIEAGERAGCRTILIQGAESREQRAGRAKADKVASSLKRAVDWILKQLEVESWKGDSEEGKS